MWTSSITMTIYVAIGLCTWRMAINLCACIVSDIAIFVLKRDVKLQLTN